MIKLKILGLILFFGIPFTAFCQDIIQKTDNTTITCKVIEITETSVLYKSWDYLSGPNRSILKNTIVKIIFEDGKVEFFNEKMTKTPLLPVISPAQTTVNSTGSSSPNEKEIIETSDQTSILEYAPTRLTVGYNSTGIYSVGADYEYRLISDYVNIGLGFWGHGTSTQSDTYSSWRVYMSGFLPINFLMNAKKINRGFFPFFQPGVDMVLQFPEGGGTYFNADLIYRVGTDYYFTDKFGISYSYSSGNMNNFGISFRW